MCIRDSLQGFVCVGKPLLVAGQSVDTIDHHGEIGRLRPVSYTHLAHFMHTETFEEINIDKNLITNYDLMADGQIV